MRILFCRAMIFFELMWLKSAGDVNGHLHGSCLIDTALSRFKM